MKSFRLACALILAVAACGDDGGGDDTSIPPGPFDDLELAHDLPTEGLDGAIHVARDEFGVMHIHATTLADLAYAEGYVMAHDRLPQMDILRRFGSGRLSELFGALEQGVIETDLEMRVHRMRPLAEESLAQLRASSDTADQELVTILDRFADGVNAYAADLQGELWTLDPAVQASFDPARFTPWDPVDSLVLGRFQAFALSWTTPIEVDISEVYQGLYEAFDLATAADPAPNFQRVGISKDLLRITPVGRRSTIDGFPNVETDTGTRSDAGRPDGNRVAPTGIATATPPHRPHVPRELLQNARAFFKATMKNGPHAFMAPRAGSNNWVVADEVAGGKTLIRGAHAEALLACDRHDDARAAISAAMERLHGRAACIPGEEDRVRFFAHDSENAAVAGMAAWLGIAAIQERHDTLELETRDVSDDHVGSITGPFALVPPGVKS